MKKDKKMSTPKKKIDTTRKSVSIGKNTRRPTEKELKEGLDKIIKQYGNTIKNLARR